MAVLVGSWKARARRDYWCDMCGGMIKKGEERWCYGSRGGFCFIDRNFCSEECLRKYEEKKWGQRKE